jgi:putative hydrolases of HD superfamily
MDSSEESLAQLLEVLLTLDRLKSVERQNPLVHQDRRENTAEHSWSLALAVILFRRYAAEPVDLGRALSLAIVHDIPEAFVGDTFVYSDAIAKRFELERAAMDHFLERSTDISEVHDIVRWWQEYELTESPEGRYVLALDVLLPVFMNHRNLSNSSWNHHGVTAKQVTARIQKVEAWIPALARIAQEAVDEALTTKTQSNATDTSTTAS